MQLVQLGERVLPHNKRTVLQTRKQYIKQCCGSGMFVQDPDFSIPDPGSNKSNKREGENTIVVLLFCVATNIIKLKIILFLNFKNVSQFKKNFNTF